MIDLLFGVNQNPQIIGGIGGWVYSLGYFWVLAIGLMASRGMIQIIALVAEKRWLEGSRQYPSFWWGDLIVWPLLLLVFKTASIQLPNIDYGFLQSSWWNWLVLIVSIMCGIIFHMMDKGAYSPMQWWSPTKIWHDFAIFTIFTYLFLVILPFVIIAIAKGNILCVAALIVAAILVFVFIRIQSHDYEYRSIVEAHVNIDWWLWRLISR